MKTIFEHVENRAFWHYTHHVVLLSGTSWKDYWKVNQCGFLITARILKRLLSTSGWNRYLDNPDFNGWAIHNIETMNG